MVDLASSRCYPKFVDEAIECDLLERKRAVAVGEIDGRSHRKQLLES